MVPHSLGSPGILMLWEESSETVSSRCVSIKKRIIGRDTGQGERSDVSMGIWVMLVPKIGTTCSHAWGRPSPRKRSFDDWLCRGGQDPRNQ